MRLLQLSKPAHIIHIHHPLPLDKVALGVDGQYLVTSEVKYKPDRERLAVQWSDNLPQRLRDLLVDFPDQFEDSIEDLDIIALSKTEGDEDNWYLQACDG